MRDGAIRDKNKISKEIKKVCLASICNCFGLMLLLIIIISKTFMEAWNKIIILSFLCMIVIHVQSET